VPDLKTLLWYLGRGLQLVALVLLPYALWRGAQTSDPKTELTLMAVGGLQFLVGIAIQRAVGSR